MVNNNQLVFGLVEKKDRNGNTYYIGSGDAPIFIDVQNSTLLFFPPNEDSVNAKLLIRNRDFVNKNKEHRDDDDRDR